MKKILLLAAALVMSVCSWAQNLESGVYEIKNVSSEGGGVGRGYLVDFADYSAGPSIGECPWTDHKNKHPQQKNSEKTCSYWYLYNAEGTSYLFSLSTLGSNSPKFLVVGTQSSKKCTWSPAKNAIEIVNNPNVANSVSIRNAGVTADKEYLSMGCGTNSTSGCIMVDGLSDGGCQLQFISAEQSVLTTDQKAVMDAGIAICQAKDPEPYKFVSEIENGKTYVIINKHQSVSFLLHTDNGVVTAKNTTGMGADTEWAKADQYVAKKQDNGKYVFQNVATGEYLAWKGASGGVNNNSGFDTQIAEHTSWTVAKGTRFDNTFYITVSKRAPSDNKSGVLILQNNGTWSAWTKDENLTNQPYSNNFGFVLVDGEAGPEPEEAEHFEYVKLGAGKYYAADNVNNVFFGNHVESYQFYGTYTNPTADNIKEVNSFSFAKAEGDYYSITDNKLGVPVAFDNTKTQMPSNHATQTVRPLTGEAASDTKYQGNTNWIIKTKGNGFTIGPSLNDANVNWNKHGQCLGMWGSYNDATVITLVPADLESLNDLLAQVKATEGCKDTNSLKGGEKYSKEASQYYGQVAYETYDFAAAKSLASAYFAGKKADEVYGNEVVTSITASTVESPVAYYVHCARQNQSYYWNSIGGPTNVTSEIAEVAFVAVADVADAYYIYNITAGKFMSYNDVNNGKGKTTNVDNMNDAKYWNIVYKTSNGGFFEIRPYSNGSVANTYMNWHGGLPYGNNSMGFYSSNGDQDKGSSWTIIKKYTSKEDGPTGETEFTVVDNGDNTVTVTPSNATALWYVSFVPTSELAGLDEEEQSNFIEASFWEAVADITSDHDAYVGEQKVTPTDLSEGSYKAVVGYVKYDGETLMSYIPAGTPENYNFVVRGTTGISAVAPVVAGKAIFNLQGQRIQKLQKGINIVGGQKVVR